MDKFDPFADYFGLSDLFNKNSALPGGSASNLQNQTKSSDILQQDADMRRCSEQLNSFVEYSESAAVDNSVDQLCMHPVEAWLQCRSSTPDCNGHVDDYLDMENVRRPLEDYVQTGTNRSSICEDMPDALPEGRPLLGTHSRRNSQSSFSSEISMETLDMQYKYMDDLPHGAEYSDDRLSPLFFVDGRKRGFAGTQTLMPRFRPGFEMCCALCKRNGETREYYTTHVLKDNRGKVICPILRKYVCPLCQATGDNAHTVRHCPVADDTRALHQTFQTRHNSSGRKRLY